MNTTLRVFEGTHQDKLARVCEVRDAIRRRLETWIAELPGDSSRPHAAEPPRKS